MVTFRQCNKVSCVVKATACTAALLLSVALLPSTALAAAADAEADADAAILRQLRSSVHAWNPAWPTGWDGWQLASSAAPCLWHGVTCDERGRVTKLVLASSDVLFASTGVINSSNPKWRAEVFPFGSRGGRGPLLPALAQLRRLTHLDVAHLFAGLETGLPDEWCRSGSFPSLTRLRLSARSLGAPLPDIQPGALPALGSLQLELPWLRTSLPASWGADPAVLPALEELKLQAAFEGTLPPGWHRGYHSLRSMSLRIRHADVPPLSGGLPPEWAAGFPRLQALRLEELRVSQPTLPAAWAQRGFPMLQTLMLDGLGLNGTLPATLLPAHPGLRVLGLANSRLSGTLPADWGAHQSIEVVDLLANLLTGPAFPPAWLRGDALPRLRRLELSSNFMLGGTLPADLPWRSIQEIGLAFTAVSGSIPAAWCEASFNASLRSLAVTSTDVVEALPPCAEKSLPLFSLEGIVPAASSSAAGPLAIGHSAAAAGLLVTALGSVAVAWGVRLHRRRRRRPDARGCEEQGLLLPQQPPLARGAGNRRRLEALLSRQLASGGGIDVLPLDALPALFTHQVAAAGIDAADRDAEPAALVGPAGKAASDSANSSSLGSSWGWPSPSLETAGSSDGLQPVLPPGLQTAAVLSRASTGDTPLEHAQSAEATQSGAAELASRQWGLETRGLRLQPEALELLAGPGGSLVELGAGSHAVVYLGRLSGRQVAVKVFELHPGMHSHAVWQEASLMRHCSHPRVLSLLGIALKGHLLLLVTQLMRGGSLRAALEDPQRRPLLRWTAHGRQVALDVAEALAHLHGELQVRHTDLKASNVLLSEGWRACLADLGLAQMVGQAARSAAGFTATHAAPEQLLAQRCSLAADVYSLGLVLAELTAGQVLKRRGEWRLPRSPEECPAVVAHIIQQCTLLEPEARPSAAEVRRALLEA